MEVCQCAIRANGASVGLNPRTRHVRIRRALDRVVTWRETTTSHPFGQMKKRKAQDAMASR